MSAPLRARRLSAGSGDGAVVAGRPQPGRSRARPPGRGSRERPLGRPGSPFRGRPPSPQRLEGRVDVSANLEGGELPLGLPGMAAPRGWPGTLRSWRPVPAAVGIARGRRPPRRPGGRARTREGRGRRAAARGCRRAGLGGGVWLPRLPGAICMCVRLPQTSCSSAPQVGAGRAGRAGGGCAETRAPPHPDATSGSAAAPRRLPLRGPPARPGRAERPAPRWGRAPLGLAGRLRFPHRAWPLAPRRLHRPGSPEGRSHERDVQLPPHRGHRLPVRRGLRQWLHQYFGVSEPSSRGARAGRGRGGPGAVCVRSAASCRQGTWSSPSFKEPGSGSPPPFRERK